MKTFTHTLAKSAQITVALGLFAVAVPVFAQPGAAPTAPAAAVAAPAPAPVVDPQAKKLLEETAAYYRTLKSYSVTVERSGRKQLIEFSAPSSLKVSSIDADGTVTPVQYYSATELITTQKPNDVVEYRTTAFPAPTEGQNPNARLASAGGLLFSSFLVGINPLAGKRHESTSLALGQPTTVNGVAVTPVIATVPKTEQLPYEQTITIFIGQDKIIQSIKSELKLPNDRTSTSTENFSKIQPNVTLPASTFTFTPPAGAEKVERFSSPKVRAVVGQAPLSLGTNVKDILGKEISYEQYKGKVVLVDFWATWCGPCIAELPNVKANYAKYKDQGFDVLGISLDQSTEPLTKYIAEKEMPWRQVFDGYWDGPIATSYNVRAIPSTILIGKDGKIAAIGARGDALEPAIKAALAAPAA